MRVYIQTRGKTVDYSFLGKAPIEHWWLHFRDATSFEKPTLILQADKKTWKCFLSGIPSNRKDRVGTTIRYTLVLEGDCKEFTNDEDKIISPLVISWLKDASTELTGTTIKNILDSALTEDIVEHFFKSRTDNSIILEVEDILKNKLNSLKESDIKSNASRYVDESWIGSIFLEKSLVEIGYRVQHLLNGNLAGAVGLFNLLGTSAEVTDFAKSIKLESIVALIIPSPLDNISSIETIELASPKKRISHAETSPQISKQKTECKSITTPMIVVGIALTLVVGIAIIYIRHYINENHGY